MTHTDSHLSHDENLNNLQYKKWTAIRIVNKKKEGMHKNPTLVKKQARKKQNIKSKDREYLDEVFVLPVVFKDSLCTNINEPIHSEIIKSIPTYISPRRRTWWEWLRGTNVTCVENNDNDSYSNIIKEIAPIN